MSRRNNQSSSTAKATGVVLVALVILAAIGGVMAYEQVPEGHVGAERVFGDVTGAQYTPGPHIIAPWKGVQNVEVRPRTYTMSDTGGEGKKAARQDAIQVQSVNGTTHRVDVTIRYHVEPEHVDGFVTTWQDEKQMEHRLIRPTVRSQMRDEAAAIPTNIIYRAEGRERLAASAHEALTKEFAGEPIVLEAVQVREVTIPPDYQRELNKREVAKAEITRKEHEVEVEKREAKRKRIEAEANADVIAIEGEAIRENPEILKLRYIEAIDETDKVIVGGGDAPVILDATEDGE